MAVYRVKAERKADKDEWVECVTQINVNDFNNQVLEVKEIVKGTP